MFEVAVGIGESPLRQQRAPGVIPTASGALTILNPSRTSLGESSGGGLALATVLALKDRRRPLPSGVVAICPMTDLTVSGPSILEHQGHDPAVHRNGLTFFAGAYFQRHDPTDPLVSPLYGDFDGFPPLLVQAVRGEVLESDATRLVARARDSGVDVSIRIVPDSVHSFPLFSFLPETTRALAEIASFVRRHATPRLEKSGRPYRERVERG